MQTTTDSSQLTHPIDAMYLMHRALRAEAARVAEAVDALEMGGGFKPFHRTFYRWATALGYHLDVEERYFTAWSPDVLLAQAQEIGPGHVMAMLEDLQTYLHAELGRMIVIPRTHRQLRRKVIALGIVQDDLLEAEEECVLPVIREQRGTAARPGPAAAARPGGPGPWLVPGLAHPTRDRHGTTAAR